MQKNRERIGKVTRKELEAYKVNERLIERNMKKIEDDVSARASDFGIKVIDVRIVRVDLPKENSEAIFKRMFTDRNKEAREYRAQGKEQAQIIVSTAEKEATIINANAERDAQIIRGEGDAVATKTFARAFNRDPDFYKFYRSMQAYKQSIEGNNTRMVLSPESDFMSYFGDKSGINRR